MTLDFIDTKEKDFYCEVGFFCLFVCFGIFCFAFFLVEERRVLIKVCGRRGERFRFCSVLPCMCAPLFVSVFSVSVDAHE